VAGVLSDCFHQHRSLQVGRIDRLLHSRLRSLNLCHRGSADATDRFCLLRLAQFDPQATIASVNIPPYSRHCRVHSRPRIGTRRSPICA
jgi:hypothetical protein